MKIPFFVERVRGVFAGRMRRVLLCLGIVLGVCLVLRMILPALVERSVGYFSRQYLGLPAQIGNVDLSLWAGGIVLENVNMAAKADDISPAKAALHPPVIDAKSALLHIDRLAFRWSWWDLLRGRLLVKEFALDAPTIRLLREADGKIDPLRYARPVAVSASSSKPAAESKPGRPWQVELRRFVLRKPNVSIVDVPTGADLLEFSLESFEIDQASNRDADFGLGAVAIHGPVLRVQRELILAEPKTAEPASPSPAATPSAATNRSGFRIKQINIERAEFAWLSAKGPLDVTMTLKASGLTADQGKRFPLELALQLGKGSVDLSGEVGVLPPYYKGRIRWDGISFSPLLLAVAPELAAWLQSTSASGDLKVTADLAGEKGSPSVRFSGRTTLENFVAADPSGSGFAVGWKRLDLITRQAVIPLATAGKPAQSPNVEIERISLIEPRLLYTHPWPLLENFLGWDPAQKATMLAFVLGVMQQDSKGDKDVGKFLVDQVEIKSGEIDMRDNTAVAEAKVRDLNLDMRSARFPEATFDAFSMQAILPTDSRFSIEGSLHADETGEFLISVQGLDLPTFSPYARDAGVTLDAGRFSLQTKLKMQGDVITMDNDVVMNKLGLSLLHPDWFLREFGLPINLALALLRDAGGDIRLQVPVHMDEKGTSISMGAVMASALRASLLGAISTPLKLVGLGAGGKGGPDKPAGVAIKAVPGGAELAPGAATRLDGLVKLLADRPELGLSLRGRIGAADIPVLSDRLLVERAKAGQKLPELSHVGFLERRRIGIYLARRGKGLDASLSENDRAVYARYVAATEVPADQLITLAKERAEKVRDLLVSKGVNTKRLTVGDRDTDGDPGVVVSLKPMENIGSSPGKPAKARKSP